MDITHDHFEQDCSEQPPATCPVQAAERSSAQKQRPRPAAGCSRTFGGGRTAMVDSASAEMDFDECFSPGAGKYNLLGLRLGGLFGILAVSTIGVAVPFWTYVEKRETLFFFLRAFASGVVLMTGFVHVLADAYPILSDPCLGLSTEYPWAMVFAGAAAILTFNLEWCLHKHFHKRLRQPGPNCQSVEMSHVGDLESSPKDPKDFAAGGLASTSELKRLDNAVHSYTFEIGIIFHSIFIGITLGVSQNSDTVRALMIALMFHQGNEGLALGVLFVKAGYSKIKYLIMAAAFVIVTPLGVAIGIGVSNSYNAESKAALGTEGVFDAVSAGILIYNGLVDLIVPTFEPTELPQKWWLQAIGFGSLYTGAAIMALIGKWA